MKNKKLNIFSTNDFKENVVCSILETTTQYTAITGKTQTKTTAFETNLDSLFRDRKNLEKEIIENLKGLRYDI